MDTNETVLVIDDERHIRLFLRGLLKRNGYTNVVEGSNGREAIELVRTHTPGAVLLDLNMPGLDGTEVLREIRANGNRVKVIVLSARASENTVQACLANGADAFVRKDTSTEEILETLGRIMDS